MNVLGVPVILTLNKRIKEKEERLQELQDIAQEYLDMLDEYEWNKEEAITGTIDPKDLQYPDVQVRTRLNVSFAIPNIAYMYVEPQIIIYNTGDHTYKISKIIASYFVCGGKNKSKNYPLSTLFNTDGTGIDSYINVTAKSDLISEAIKKKYDEIKPGEIKTYHMPKGYCNVIDPEEQDEKAKVITRSYKKYLKEVGTGAIVTDGQKMSITIFWGDSEVTNGRALYEGIKGDLVVGAINGMI